MSAVPSIAAPCRVPTTLVHDAVEDSASQRSGKPALRILHNGALRGYTYAQLVEEFRAAARALTEAGLRPGDRVALLSANSPEWPIAYLAITAAGGTAVPLDAGLPASEFEKLLELADVRLVIASCAMSAKLGAALQRWPCWTIEDGVCADPPTLPRLLPAKEDPDADSELASILFTSGTCGRPKGVMLTHTNLVYTARCMIALSDISPSDELLAVLPFHHVYPFVSALLTPLLAGTGIAVVEAVRPDLLVQTMAAARPTFLIAVPRLLEVLHQGIRRQVASRGRATRVAFRAMSLASRFVRSRTNANPGPVLFRQVMDKFGGRLRKIITGGAPLSADLAKGLVSLGFDVLEGYGSTETAGGSSSCRYSQWRPGKVGWAYPLCELRLEESGEIVVRGPTVMRGYFRDAEATARVLRDGWYHTGDRGELDKDGYLTVLGRLDELIVTPAGKKAAPDEVELRYAGLPGVKELAVFGMPLGEHTGAHVHAAVVIDSGLHGDVSAEQLREKVKAAIAARSAAVPTHLRIQKLHFVHEIPKTTKLSIKRGELRNAPGA